MKILALWRECWIYSNKNAFFVEMHLDEYHTEAEELLEKYNTEQLDNVKEEEKTALLDKFRHEKNQSFEMAAWPPERTRLLNQKVDHVYLLISEDLENLSFQPPHFPVHQLWNAYSPFERYVVEIPHLSCIKQIKLREQRPEDKFGI